MTLPELHTAQVRVKSEAKRFNVLCCGRRWGKDTLGQELLVSMVLDGYPVAWFAPTFRMLVDNFRDVTRMVRPMATKVNATERRIELYTGGIIDMWSLDVPDAARGRKYALVVINEAAIVPELRRAFQYVIRPTLVDYRGEAWFLSTPRGFNDFKVLYDNALHLDNWQSWTYATHSNPHLPPDEVAQMRAGMSEGEFRQEVLAEFTAVEGALFKHEQFKIVDAAPGGLKWVRTYDLAVTTREASDRTASLCGAYGVTPCACCGVANPIYLRDGFAFKAEYPDVKARMIQQAQLDGRAVKVAIESVAFQLAAVQELQRAPELLGYTILAEQPKGDKIARLRPAQHRAEQGQIHLVRGAWCQSFLEEIITITPGMKHPHDDYGDALCALIKHLSEPSRVMQVRQTAGEYLPALERAMRDAGL